MDHRIRIGALLCAVLIMSLLGGCATTGEADPRDPYEGFNRGVMSFNQTMDQALFYPIASGYNAITPTIVNDGVSNFFSNLREIASTVNHLLQLNLDQALNNASRFVFNSTIGLGGFFDVSSHVGLPKNHQDFGRTLAFWGVEPGPYVVVPFFGPSTVRDAIGFGVDGAMNPLFYVHSDALRASLLSLQYIDFKSGIRSTQDLVAGAAIDEYEFTKNAYLERRAYLIDGERDPFLDDEFDGDWMD